MEKLEFCVYVRRHGSGEHMKVLHSARSRHKSLCPSPEARPYLLCQGLVLGLNQPTVQNTGVIFLHHNLFPVQQQATSLEGTCLDHDDVHSTLKETNWTP